jgi:phosphatidyl-myo-inositol dimannoside synthase
MNIVFVYLKSFSQTGGIETFNQKFIQALEDFSDMSGVKVTVLSLYDKQSDYMTNSKNVIYFGFDGDKFSTFRALVRYSNKQTIIFYGHINLVAFANLLYLAKFNRNTYFIIHGIDVWHRFSFKKRFLMNKFKYLAVSRYTRDVFTEKNNIKQKQVEVFPNCIYDNVLSRKINNPYKKHKFNILSVSRLDKDDDYKGIDSIIKALSIVQKKVPNVMYTVIGKGSDRNRLEALADKMGVKKYVDFKGFVESVDHYYEYCDLFALPSNGEGFGIVYLEAMKYKKPVIAARSGGAIDVVLDGITGYLCDYDNCECLSRRIITIHDDLNKAIVLGENGHQYMLKEFTFKKFKKRLIEIIRARM